MGKELSILELKKITFKNKKSIDKLLDEYKPTHIINCAALARRKICEKSPEEAIAVKIDKKDISEITSLSIIETEKWFNKLKV